MRRIKAAVLLLIPAWSAAQTPTSVKPGQSSSGNCSPNIVNSGSGPVTVRLIGSCKGSDSRLVEELNQSLKKFLAKFSDSAETIANLNKLLHKQDVELAEKVREVEEWTTRYNELTQQLEQQPADELSKQAARLLREGKLDQAAGILDKILPQDELRVGRAAQDNFNRGQAYELQFQPEKALPHYEKAYRYRPEQYSYARAYALSLEQHHRYSEAATVYLAALRAAKTNGELPRAALTLDDLGILYFKINQIKEAESSLRESLAIYSQLAKEDHVTYDPDIAKILSTLGAIYVITNQIKEAEKALDDSLSIYLRLSGESKYRPQLVHSLNGNLYVLRELAKRNPAVYQLFAAVILVNLTKLGSIYAEGSGGVPKDEVKAVELYRKVADAGGTMANVFLGRMYAEGRGGLPKDDVKAVGLFRAAASTGSAEAEFDLGMMYLEGRGGLPKDEAKAAELFGKAATAVPMAAFIQGPALTKLGFMYEHGRGGLPKDEVKAVELYRKGFASNDLMAASSLGRMYLLGRGGLPKDEVKAVELFRTAVAANQPEATTLLGIAYANGFGGLPKDEVKAVELFRTAAAANQPEAITNLGMMYAIGGGGLPMDEVRAIELYRKATDMGEPNAMERLAWYCVNGRGGVPKDEVYAAELLNRAAQIRARR